MGTSLDREQYKVAIPQLSKDINEFKDNNVKINRIVVDLTNGKAHDIGQYAAYFQNLTTGYFTAIAGDIEYLSSRNAYVTHLKADVLDGGYARIDAANITELGTESAWINNLLVHTDLLSQSGTIYKLNAIELDANRITAGTLDVERLVITDGGHKYLLRIDPTTQVQSYEKLDGDIVGEHTLHADKLITHTITTDHITVGDLAGTNGKINLHDGTFYYATDGTWASATKGIMWDGSDLKIKGNVTITGGNVYTKTETDNSINNIRSWYATCSTAAATADKVATISPTTTEFTPSVLKAGTLVNVKFTNTNSAAVGSLTLNINGTGAKPIKTLRYGVINNIAGVGYLAANTTYQFTYDGTNWVVQENYNADTYNRTRFQNAIKAATAITSTRIICGTSSGYKNIGASVAFDISYPLLYAGAAIEAAATGDNNYLSINSINASNNGTITGGAANKTLYLKGTLSGSTFTIASSGFLTTTVPSSRDGFVYLPLGVMYSATNIYFVSPTKMYAYKGGKFQEVGLGFASAHITEIDGDGIKVHADNNATTNYVKIDSTGMEVYKGGNSVAQYGDTVRVGTITSYHTDISSSGFLLSNNSSEIFKVGGSYLVFTKVAGGGFFLTHDGNMTNMRLSDNSEQGSGHETALASNGSVAFGGEVIYIDGSSLVYRQTQATGVHSFANGKGAIASGDVSAALGLGTAAGYGNQTVMGKYNNNSSSTAFEIGNGTGASARSNALTVDWDGFVGAENVNLYGACSTAAATAAKTVTVGFGSFKLKTGATVTVKFTNSNTAASPTLNVNSTGAKAIMRYGTTAAGTGTSTSWNAGSVVTFVYDGTYWMMCDHLNTTYYTESCVVSTAAATAAKVGSLSNYALQKGYLQVAIYNANTYAGAITLNINSTGAKPIYINGKASSASNYTLPKAMYLVYYDGTNFYFRTDEQPFYSLGGGYAITANENLDSLMRIGNYYCSATATARTLTGTLPVAASSMVAFTMKVEYAVGTSYTSQTLIMYDSGIRYYRDNTTTSDTTKWGAWKTYDTLAGIGAAASSHTHSNYVPTTRKVNSKALSADITLSASDVSAVPTTRKVNNKALSADITLSASDVGAAASSHTHSNYVPTSRTVNGHALTGNVTVTAADVGAMPTGAITIEKFEKDNVTISAASNTSVTITKTLSGKTPLCIVGWNLNNSASGGQNVSLCTPYSVMWSTDHVMAEIRNNNGEKQAKIDVIVYVLCVKS